MYWYIMWYSVTAWRSSSSCHDVEDNNTVFLEGFDSKADYGSFWQHCYSLSSKWATIKIIFLGHVLSFPSFYCTYMHFFLNLNVNISRSCERCQLLSVEDVHALKVPTHTVFACLSRAPQQMFHRSFCQARAWQCIPRSFDILGC